MRGRALPLPALPLILAALVVSFALWFGGALASGQTTSPAPSATFTPILAPRPAPPFNPADPGVVLYLRDCAWCHGNQADGTTRGPSLIGVGAASADFELSTGRMPLTKVEEEPERRTPHYTP